MSHEIGLRRLRLGGRAITVVVVLSSVMILVAGRPGPVMGAPGEIDPSFGNGGFAEVGRSLGSDLDILRAPDGKILVGYVQARQPELGKAETLSTARLLPSGEVDRNFAGDGVANLGRQLEPLAVDEQGRTLLGGMIEVSKPSSCGGGRTTRSIIMRLRVNGTPDPSFGNDGVIRIMPRADEPGWCGNSLNGVRAIWVEPGGGGAVRVLWDMPPNNTGGAQIPAQIRLLADGSLDSSFADDGRALLGAGRHGTSIGWVFGDDGSLTNYVGQNEPWMGRLLPDGDPDPVFGGGDGVATTGVPKLGKLASMLRQQDGKYLLSFLGKTTSENPDGRLRLARVNSDGSADVGFNNLARIFDFAGNGGGTIFDVTQLDDDRILLGGYRRFAHNVTSTGEDYTFGHALAVLGNDGLPSTDFGTGGRVTFRSENMQGFTALPTATGRIVQPVFISGDPGTVGVVRLCGYTPCEGVEPSQIIWGTNGADSLSGTYAKDRINGRRGKDRINGHRGNDKIVGGRGKDILSGGKGADLIVSRDGMRDVVRCGAGRDRVVADRRDQLASDCERVRRR